MVKLNLEPEWIRVIRLITTVEDRLLSGLAAVIGSRIQQHGGTHSLLLLHSQLTELWSQLALLDRADQLEILEGMIQAIDEL